VYDRLTLGRQRARDRRGEERKEEAHLVNPLQSHLSSSSISVVFLVDKGVLWVCYFDRIRCIL
jgi:hypothetical protein